MQRCGNTRMSGSISTSGTSGIPTRRVVWAQNPKAMPVAPVGACPARGSAPGGFERTRDTRGPGVTAPHRQGAQRAARPGTNQSLWGQGGSVGCPIPPPPSPGNELARLPTAPRTRSGTGNGRRSGNGEGGLFLRPSDERGSGICRGESSRAPRGPLLPPRGRGAVANERSRRVGGRGMPGITLG